MRTCVDSNSKFVSALNFLFASVAPLLLVAMSAPNASAEAILYDSHGFESPTFTAGTPIGQAGWIGVGGGPNAFAVQSSKVASGSQAVVANGIAVNDASFAFPVIGYVPNSGERLDIQVDMARTISAHSASGSPVYAIDIYNENSDRLARFGLMDNGGTINAFANGDSAHAPVIFDDAIASNTFVHFEMILDFEKQTAQLYIDGQASGNVPLPFLTDAFALGAAALQIGALSDQNDKGYFDNYRVGVLIAGDATRDGIVDGADYPRWADHFLQTGQTWDNGDFSGDGRVDGVDYTIWADHFSPQVTIAAVVPEPSSAVLVAIGLTGLGVFQAIRRRR